MTDEQKKSVVSVLTAALHNAKIVKDQLESLVNNDDDSFPDFRMDYAITEVDQAIKAIQDALDGING